MRFVDDVVLALGRLRKRPVRSFLLLQGTIWGVAISLFPTAVIDGTRASVARRATDVGADRVAVTLDPTRVDPKPLTPADLEAVRARWTAAGIPAEAAAGVALSLPPRGTASAPGVPVAALLGPGDAFTARGLVLASGRAGDPAAPADAPEAVLEALLAAEVAAARGGSALGARVVLPDGRKAVVVGRPRRGPTWRAG
jgi:hypothetical protein